MTREFFCFVTNFNSCDGLGLARDLAQVNIPNVIVLKEPIPEQIAQRFLEYFLVSFSQGKSLNLSVRDARIRLKDDQNEEALPCADCYQLIIKIKRLLASLFTPHIDRIEKAISIAKANQGRLSLFGSITLYTSLTINSGQSNATV